MTKNLIDYEQILSSAKTKDEILETFRRMSDDADNLVVIPSKEHLGASDLFFSGLKGVETSFIVFKKERLAKRFMVDDTNENEIIYVVIDGTIYYLPFAKLH